MATVLPWYLSIIGNTVVSILFLRPDVDGITL